MTKADAHRILDAARSGAAIHPDAIFDALVVTGDITRLTHSEIAIASRLQ